MYIVNSNSLQGSCATNNAEKYQNSHVSHACVVYKIPQTIIEEEGHRIETPSRGSEWYYRERVKA